MSKIADHLPEIRAAIQSERDRVQQRYRKPLSEYERPMNVEVRIESQGPIVSAAFLSSRCTGSRKVFPGEVVTVDAADKSVAVSLAKKHIEPTLKDATRPLVFASAAHAKFTNPQLARAERNSNPQAVKQAEEEVAQEMADWNAEFRKIGGPSAGIAAGLDPEVREAAMRKPNPVPANANMDAITEQIISDDTGVKTRRR